MRSQQIGIAFLTLAGLAIGGDETGSTRNPPKPRAFCSSTVPSITRRPPPSVRTRWACSRSAASLPETGSKRARSSAISATRSLRAALDVPPHRRPSEIAIRVAEAKHKLAQSQLERTQKLINRNFASVEELSIQTQEEEVERLSIEEARTTRRWRNSSGSRRRPRSGCARSEALMMASWSRFLKVPGQVSVQPDS